MIVKQMDRPKRWFEGTQVMKSPSPRRHLAIILVHVAAAAAMLSGCQVPRLDSVGGSTNPDKVQESSSDTESNPRPSDPELQTGIMVRSVEENPWGFRLTFPFSVGLTDFDLASGVPLGNLATASIVPTGEFIVPIDEKWTLLPFAGVGGATALGDQKAVGGKSALGLSTGGLRVQRWQPFADHYVFVLGSQVRYDAAWTSRNGLLGDWGEMTGSVELRRNFGAPNGGPRFQPGIYAQGIWFWDPVELDIPGVTPTFIDNQLELGVSLGSSTPYNIWGLSLPRIFVGVRFGNGLTAVSIRFGRL